MPDQRSQHHAARGRHARAACGPHRHRAADDKCDQGKPAEDGEHVDAGTEEASQRLGRSQIPGLHRPEGNTTEALEAELTSLREENPNLTLHLQADQDVPYRSVAMMMAVIERAGVMHLAGMTANQ